MVFTIDDRIQLERQQHQDLKIGVLTCDRTYGNLINGEWIKDGETFDVFNKYTNEPIAKICKADEALTKKAIDNAYETFKNERLSVIERHDILMKAVELFRKHKEELINHLRGGRKNDQRCTNGSRTRHSDVHRFG